MPVCVVWCVKIFTFKRVFMCLFSSKGIWNLDPIIELPFLWLLLLSPHWYVSNSIPSHKKLVMVSANVHHISFWVWTCVILLRPQHDGLSRAGFAHLVGCYTLCSAKQTWPRDLGKVCVLQLDRSQSLFYFVPQEKRLRWRPQRTWKKGESIFHPENMNILPKTGKSMMAYAEVGFGLFIFQFHVLLRSGGPLFTRWSLNFLTKVTRSWGTRMWIWTDHHSAAYFSRLNSAQVCSLLWFADQKPQPISRRTFNWPKDLCEEFEQSPGEKGPPWPL